MAGDLHDMIGQKLTALGISLDIVRQQMPQAGASAVAGRLFQMATLLEETIAPIVLDRVVQWLQGTGVLR